MDLARAYDAINAAIFVSSGGSHRLRQRLVDALEVRPGQRVLELGCGTGQVTARLVAAGATVVAVDALAAMLEAARCRAPTATFVHGDAIEAEVGGGFDHVVLSFVLHSFDRQGRVRLLRRAAAALAPTGSIGVLEWSQPEGRWRRTLWRRFLRALEPAPEKTLAILDGALDEEVPSAGLRVRARASLAGGRTQLLVLAAKPV
jgi:demethylmenaquinone methyltransferase/2-methoxy-6-polyprenyl-1,4-benzoquinol methylase